MTIKINSVSLERIIKSKIPRGFKLFLVNFICNELIGKLIKLLGLRSNLFGGYFIYNLVSDKEAAKIFFGIWESAEIRLAKRNITSKTIIELGSSVGVMLGVLSQCKKIEKYICVEANPINYKKLRKLIYKLPSDFPINTYHNAINYDSEFIDLYLSATQSSSVYKEKSLVDSTCNIKTITLSKLIDKEKIKYEYALVTDIEGSEADIFFRDSSALNFCREIICELDYTNKFSIKSQVDRLREIGFICVEQYQDVFYFQRIKQF